jgi:hypothetical protein
MATAHLLFGYYMVDDDDDDHHHHHPLSLLHSSLAGYQRNTDLHLVFLCYFDRASLYRIISLTNFNAQFSIH